jgi:hypothetical protein
MADPQKPSRPPELIIETLLLAGRLPMEQDCVLCGAATEHALCCRTVCEIAYVHRGGSSWVGLLAFLLFGWIGALIAATMPREEKQRGSDRVYPLPLRVCESCAQQLTNEQAVKDALYRVPLYRRLLDRYPRAYVSHIA